MCVFVCLALRYPKRKRGRLCVCRWWIAMVMSSIFLGGGVVGGNDNGTEVSKKFAG